MASPRRRFSAKRHLVTQLNGVVTSQLQGVDPGLFGSRSAGIVRLANVSKSCFVEEVCMIVNQVADRFFFYVAGTCPFGQMPDVATCSCH